MGEDARKFILQSIGRGVRIEPIKNKRKRLLQLYNAGEIDKELFDKIKDKVLPIETLFIFGTSKSTLIKVIGELEKEGKHQIFSSRNKKAIKNRTPSITTHRVAKHSIPSKEKRIKFDISQEDFELLKNFIRAVDDRVLLVRYNLEPAKIKFLKDELENDKSDVFNFNEKSIKNIDQLIQRFFDYFSAISEEF